MFSCWWYHLTQSKVVKLPDFPFVQSMLSRQFDDLFLIFSNGTCDKLSSPELTKKIDDRQHKK